MGLISDQIAALERQIEVFQREAETSATMRRQFQDTINYLRSEIARLQVTPDVSDGATEFEGLV